MIINYGVSWHSQQVGNKLSKQSENGKLTIPSELWIKEGGHDEIRELIRAKYNHSVNIIGYAIHSNILDTILIIDGKEVSASIYVNQEGKLEIRGIGSVVCKMLNEELILNRPEGWTPEQDG